MYPLWLGRSLRARLCRVAILVMGLNGWVPGQPLHGAELADETGRIRTNRLREISGLAASRQNPDVLWLHNDGDSKEVYAVGIDGRLRARVRIGAKLEDVEDIAVGRGRNEGADFVYLGDIGDNEEERREVQVVRFEEPRLLPAGDDQELAVRVESFRLKYPDGPHDAEALLVDPLSSDLFIVTKEERVARLYRAAADNLRSGRVIKLEPAGSLRVGPVSGGDVSPTGDAIVLRSEDRGWLWSRQAGEPVELALRRAPRRVLARASRQSENGESIGFRADGRGYYTVSEGEHEPLVFFPLPPGGAGSGR